MKAIFKKIFIFSATITLIACATSPNRKLAATNEDSKTKVLNPSEFGGLNNCKELLSNLHQGAIPSKFTYLGKGAILWESLMVNSNSVANEPEVRLLNDMIPTLLKNPQFLKGTNIVDIGPGDGKKAAEILKLLNGQVTSYLGVDVSPSILALAINRLKTTPNLKVRQQIADVESENFRMAVQNMEAETRRPSLFFLLGQTLGNPRNIPRFISNVRKSMSPNSTLVVGVDFYNPSKIPALLKEYSNPEYLDMDLWVLEAAGLVPGRNGEIKIDFDYKTNNIRGVFIVSKETSVSIQDQETGSAETVVLKANQEIIFFQSHRFSKDEIRSIFKNAGLKVVTISNDNVTNYGVITAIPTN